MGYDLSIENPPAEVVEIRRRLYPEETGGVAVELGGEERGRLFEELRAAEHRTLSYFRLSIWGMSDYREAMERAGMLFYPQDGSGGWGSGPTPDAFNVPKTDEGFWDENSAEYLQYRAAWQAYIDRDYGEVGIPAHKLGSNDGWLVTPAECSGAVAAWREYVDEKEHQLLALGWQQDNEDDEEPDPELEAAKEMDATEPEYWLKWIQFLETAAERGGFRVW